MKSSVRPTVILVILALLLVPALSFAKTAPAHSTLRTSVASPSIEIFGAFTSVWNLLTQHLKSGIGLDPSGSPTAPAPSSTGGSTGSSGTDTGTQLDPSGAPR